MSLKATFHLILHTCFAIVRRIAWIVAGGTSINWLFVLIMFITLSNWTVIKFVAIVLVFVVGFPIAWLLLGKTYGLRQGIYELTTTHKTTLLEYIMHQLLTAVQAKTSDNPKIQQSLLQSRQWFVGMPAPVKWVMSALVNYLPLNEVLQEVIQNQKITKENLIVLSRLAAQQLDARTNIGLLQPSPFPLWVLAAGNLMAMVLVGIGG
ncbi:MAG: hypothetical protein RMJ87_07215 [Cytophagales bacterium]|nr:hypothetical protein [Bernardetiaceae bacterium]MDW8204801.1 hypothetical protein [Cytophagales bacterium]